MKLYIGKVIDNDSNNAPDKDPIKGNTGCIQLKIEPLMWGSKIDAANYPWFRPAQSGTGGSSTFGTSCIPEIDSYVWCFFEEENQSLFKKGFYLWNVNLKTVTPHNLYTDKVKNKVTAESVYPDVKFMHFKNNINIAVSSGDKPEITIYHPKTFLFINKDGNLHYKDNDANEITINKDGILIQDKNSNKIEMGSSSIKINNNLEVLR